jgi:hypothetical protein
MMYINRFIDTIKAQESRGARDLVMSLRDAKDLHADITKLLLTLEVLRSDQEKGKIDEVIQVEIGGGSFKSA